jgi:type III secretion YscU/HrpY family protein
MGEKTEKASSKKLRDAKKKGQVAKSQDLPAAATFIVSIAITIGMIPKLYDQIGQMMVDCFSLVTHNNLSEVLGSVFYQAMYVIFITTVPIVAAVCFIGMLVTFLTVGPVFAPDVFKFDIKKFNPIDNLKAKFKMKTVVELLKSLIKITVAGILVYQVVVDSIPSLIQSQNLPVLMSLKLFAYFLWEVVKRVGIFFAAIAIFDFMYQKYTFSKEMMMEKFEVKQEYKETEGNPEIKGRRREVAREIAYSEGPAAGAARAAAVVTNPTELAIALGFEQGIDPCPYVLAMGQGALAKEIIKIAEKFNVPIVRNLPLAHTLWEEAKMYEYIPEKTYEPVAEIIRWLAEMKHEQQVESLNL